ncbi:MAG: LemA family protein [archaeon GW2011_AR13]|nr:MAG: LemA family protein [archaeon GW2011_AR13]HIG95216.1 LemA family protein [Nanoarchaeota archaeon]HIH63097.1 LemA family protein [Nanoarchaeota archaeon]HIJ09152.1 LemA family protein [Nanoarchaeota archaeon]
MLTWILIGAGVLIVAIIFIYYNRFSVLSNRIENSLSQIDVQLKRRTDLIPNLIETVKGFAKHEKEAIKAVTDARKALVSADNVEKKIKADEGLEKALKSIFAIAEGYPDLKANTNFLELQRELASTEDKVAYSRQFYNDSILSYNNLCTTMPGLLFAKMFNRQVKEFFQVTAEERKEIKVKF